MGFLYARPDEIWTFNGAVAASSSTPIDTDYTASWLTDARSGRPIRSASVNWRATVTNPAGYIDFVALCNHNVSVTTAISGSVTGTIAAGTQTENGIYLSPYVAVTASSSATTMTATITGNAASVVVGELIAGRLRTLTPGPALQDQDRGDDDYYLPGDSEFSSLPTYDRGIERRAFSFTQFYSLAQFDLLQSWQRSQRAGTYPSLIVPSSSVNDAWVAHLNALRYKRHAAGTYAVTLEFIEYPRSRW